MKTEKTEFKPRGVNESSLIVPGNNFWKLNFSESRMRGNHMSMSAGEANVMKCKSLQCRIFTLIELLVVICIISILAGMLLPALKNAKGTAQQIKCVNNLKQIFIAAFNYTIDNKDYFPTANARPFAKFDEYLTPASKIDSLVSDVWNCPERPLKLNDAVNSSYTYNKSLYSSPTKASMIKDPSNKLFILDRRDEMNSGTASFLYYTVTGTYNYVWFGHPAAPSYLSGQANILFFDGHTGAGRRSDIMFNGSVSNSSIYYIPY